MLQNGKKQGLLHFRLKRCAAVPAFRASTLCAGAAMAGAHQPVFPRAETIPLVEQAVEIAGVLVAHQRNDLLDVHVAAAQHAGSGLHTVLLQQFLIGASGLGTHALADICQRNAVLPCHVGKACFAVILGDLFECRLHQCFAADRSGPDFRQDRIRLCHLRFLRKGCGGRGLGDVGRPPHREWRLLPPYTSDTNRRTGILQKAKKFLVNFRPAEKDRFRTGQKRPFSGEIKKTRTLKNEEGKCSEHALVLIAAGAHELHPLGHIHGVVADALQILNDHQQVQRCVHLAGVFGDLLRQLMLDGVEIVIHRVVCGDHPAGGIFVLCRQGIEGIQDHLVGLFAHGNGLTYRRVALFADGDKVGDDLGDVGGMVADALNVRDHLHGSGDAAQIACHRLLTQQQRHAAVLDIPLHIVDALC